jgi:Cu/Ag efflux pump CusA
VAVESSANGDDWLVVLAAVWMLLLVLELKRVEWCGIVMTGWPLADASGILLQLLWLWILRLTVMTGLSSLWYVAAFVVGRVANGVEL